MTDTGQPATPEPYDDGNNPLTIETGGDFTLPTYDIDPEDQDVADEILQADLIRDVPRAGAYIGKKWKPLTKLTGLPPEGQQFVREKLAQHPRDKWGELEPGFVLEALQGHSIDSRILGNVASHALPYHHEMFAIERELDQLEREGKQIAERMNKVIRVDVDIDPKTGKEVRTDVYEVTGARRRELGEQLMHNQYVFGLKTGPERERRLAKALKDSVELVKAQRAQREDFEEVDRRATQINREASIEERAKLRASFMKHSI